MNKREIERAINNNKQLFWLGGTHLLFDPIVELKHWRRDQWFATVIEDSGKLANKDIRSADIGGWSAGGDGGIERARLKLAAYQARKEAIARPLEFQPAEHEGAEELLQDCSQLHQKYDQRLRESNLDDLTYPITCESHDLDGRWILVNLVRWLGNGKWLAYDEDGERLVVDASHLKNPRL